VEYYIAWGVYGRAYNVSNLPVDLITHINYAFANVDASGQCVLGDAYADTQMTFPGDTWSQPLAGNFNQLIKLKAAHPGLKTLISVGGWTWSANFPAAAATSAARATFAKSCIAFAKQYGFDGIDIDWEYPISGGLSHGTPEDKHNFTLLMQALRSGLDAQGVLDGHPYYLTYAAAAGPDKIANTEVLALSQTVDWINLMTYDFNGAWSAQTDFNAPLDADPADPQSSSPLLSKYNVKAAVQAYLAAGVDPGKLNLGTSMHGRIWTGVPSTNNGLFQISTGGAGTGTWEPGSLDFKDIVQHYLPTYTRYWNSAAQVPYLYSATTQQFISYDDAQSLGIKVDYAKANKLGGIMGWDPSSDDANFTLSKVLNQILHETGY